MSAHKRRAAPSAHLRPRKDQGQQKSPSARFWKNARSGLTVVVALTIIAVTGAPASAAEADAIDIEAVDQFVLDSLARAGIPGAAIAITSGADVLHVRGYGHDSAQTPVTEHTPFRIASLSKAFTSLAVMQLVDAGELALDDTAYAHLPEFRIADPRGEDITVRQLLDQTSGLADREVPDVSRPQPTSLADAATSLRSAVLVADPGTEFNYHNPNYQVAARLVEVVSGQSFEQYLRDHVFHPAGMDESVDTRSDNDQIPGLAHGHVLAYGQPIAVPGPGDFEDGAGGVVSTAADMAQWLILQASRGVAANGTRLLSERSVTEMHTGRGPSHYALGWVARGPYGAPTQLRHTGNLLTFSSATAILPESGMGVTLMFNASSGILLEQTAIFNGVLDIIQGRHASPGAPLVSGKLLDSILAILTLAVILLAIRGIASSRRWAARLSGSPILVLARLAPLLGLVVVVSTIPKLAGWLLDGRDFTWVTILYSSPALAVFALATALAATVTLSARAWQLGAVAPKKRPHPAAPQEMPGVLGKARSSARRRGRMRRLGSLTEYPGAFPHAFSGGSPDSR
jgi:CubicO group peptidase (beta-lactamase class C family)